MDGTCRVRILCCSRNCSRISRTNLMAESYHDAMKAYKVKMIDWEHSYWRYAELINGRLAMLGILIIVVKYTL